MLFKPKSPVSKTKVIVHIFTGPDREQSYFVEVKGALSDMQAIEIAIKALQAELRSNGRSR